MLHLFHSWSKWKTIEEGQLYNSRMADGSKKFNVGNYQVQERVCAVCGKRQMNLLKVEL